MPRFIKDLGTKLPPSGKSTHRKRKYLVECYSCSREYELNAQDYNRNPEGITCKKCKRIKFTDEDIQVEALKYNYRNDLQTKSPWAYAAAFRRGILDDVCAHMVSKYRDTSVLAALKKRKGLYLLYMGDDIVYVGKSTYSVGDRVLQHKTEREGAKLFNKVAYYEVLNTTDLHVAEVYLINKYKPLYNKDAISTEPLTLVVDNIDSIISETIIVKDIPLAF